MGQYGSMIADAAGVGLRYAKRLVTGIPADRFGRLSTPGNQVIAANHPAFILGHLSLYPAKVFQLLGQDVSIVTPPDRYNALFAKDAKCEDDTTGTLYPKPDDLTEFFFRSYEKALEAIRAASDSQLLAENPVDTPLKQVCPTLGSMLTFYLTGHVTSHLGQLSSWRRMEGLPPA
jgi:hypothetical protein